MDTFFSMGGYAGFVWPAYALAALVLVGLLAASVAGARARESELESIQKTRGRRRSAPETLAP
jgi:heme exporter protein D